LFIYFIILSLLRARKLHMRLQITHS